MIDDGESQAAKAVVVRLSEFLRRMLDTIDTPEITVAEEINFLRSYLDIEHARRDPHAGHDKNADSAVRNACADTHTDVATLG